jgi:hypothetical protein
MIPNRHLVYSRQAVLALLLLAMVIGSVGCGLPKQWHLLADKLPEATPQDPAYQMLCIWEPAEGVGPDGLPTRGFAGKITFFTRNQATGVRVRGDMLISVFDDQSPIEERSKPIRNWEFLGDAWAIHLQDSSIGPSYSVFIPYSRKGNHQAQCALRARFTPENGKQPLYSDTVAVLLPGPPGKKQEQPLNAGQTKKRTSLQSITIPLHEKRKAHLDNLEIGKTELSHTVAPASELIQKQPARFPRQFPTPGRATLETPSSVMETLPQPPQSSTSVVMPPQTWVPDSSAKPLIPAKPTASSTFSQVPTAPPAPRHPLLGTGSDEPVGNNPFNR